MRCFIPCGAHVSARIGNSLCATACNLMSRLQQVATGKCDHLSIVGGDLATKDGTSVRDYVHVEDLAEGHVCALTRVLASGRGVAVHNLGSGKGVSVLDMVKAFQQVSGTALPYQIVQRNSEVLATVVADPAKS